MSIFVSENKYLIDVELFQFLIILSNYLIDCSYRIRYNNSII